MKRNTLSWVGVASALVLPLVMGVVLAVGAPQPPKAIEWKAVDAWGASIPENEQMVTKFVEAVNKASKGRLVIKYLGGPEVYAASELFDYLEKGTIDLVGTTPDYYSGAVPEAWMVTLVRPDDHNSGWFRKGGFLNLYNEALVARKKVMLLAHTGVRHDYLLWTRKPITSADWSGLKIRTPGKAESILLKQLGAASVSVASPEVAESLSKGIIDGMGRPCQVVHTGKEYEYVKYALGPTWKSAFTGLYISQKSWNALPKDLQNMLTDEAVKIEESFRDYWISSFKGHMKAMTEQKLIEYRELPPGEFAKIREAWRAVWKQWAASLAPGYADKFQKALEGHALWDESYSTLYSEFVTHK